MTTCTCRNCGPSGGQKVRFADGIEVCTGTIAVYERQHGPIPANWLPTSPCTDPWVLPERYA